MGNKEDQIGKDADQRRDDLIRRALRTPPKPLKEMKKKSKPSSASDPSSKRCVP